VVIVRISATDERTIKGAESVSELKGMRELLLERIEQARALLAFRKAEPKEKKEEAFSWKQAVAVAREVLSSTFRPNGTAAERAQDPQCRKPSSHTRRAA
jgi:hypothetical protein